MSVVSQSTHHFAAAAACQGINHVLKSEPWAMRELAAHAGKTVLLQLPLGNLCVEISPEGLLAPLTEFEQISLELNISSAALNNLLSQVGNIKEQAIKSVKITGDADLAQLIGRLAGQLRWEYEEDLARIVGDVPASFAVRQGKKFLSAGRSAVSDLVENAVEYVTEERKVLLNVRDFTIHKHELNELRDAVDRMEKRIQLLEKKG